MGVNRMSDNNEDYKEEQQSNGLPDFPSEQDLETWKKKQETQKENEDKEDTLLKKTKEVSFMSEQEQAKSKLNKDATDFFIHNKEDNKSKEELSELRDENSRQWDHLTRLEEDREPVHHYHDFPIYFYAGFWMRVWAFVVDTLCIGSLTGLILGMLSMMVTLNTALSAFLSVVIYLLYFVLLTKYTNGQTIGKMIFGLKVVSFTEEDLSWATVLVREGACRFILQIGPLMLGYIVAAFTPKKQHIGDLFSDTSVVTINTLKAYNGQIK